MASKEITEWRCDRCGVEAAIPTNAITGWFRLGTPYSAVQNRYQNQKKLEMGGDLCPDCTKSLWAWWCQPRQSAVKEPANVH
jgi:hypothetical protein